MTKVHFSFVLRGQRQRPVASGSHTLHRVFSASLDRVIFADAQRVWVLGKDRISASAKMKSFVVERNAPGWTTKRDSLLLRPDAVGHGDIFQVAVFDGFHMTIRP